MSVKVEFKPQQPVNVNFDKLEFPVAVMKKIDGEKLVVRKGYYSRSMKPITNNWLISELDKALEGLNINLEGEVQVDGKFKPSQGFPRTKDRQGNFIYWVFDSPMEGVPFSERHKILKAEIAKLKDPRIKVVPYLMVYNLEDLMEIHAINAQNPSLDGTVMFDPKGIYKQGKASVTKGQVLKLKDFDDDEAVIVGFEEQMQNNNPAQTNELGRTFRSSAKANKTPKGILAKYIVEWNGVECKVTATGKEEDRILRWKNKDVYLGKLVKFQYQGVFKDTGKPRFPTELGIRDKEDLDAED